MRVFVSVCDFTHMNVTLDGHRALDPTDLKLNMGVSCLMCVLGIELGSSTGAMHAQNQ